VAGRTEWSGLPVTSNHESNAFRRGKKKRKKTILTLRRQENDKKASVDRGLKEKEEENPSFLSV